MIPVHLISQIRESPAAVDAIRNHVALKVRGLVGVGLCPFHVEKTPSFRLNLAGHRHAGRYRCHGCGAHGDAMDFLMAVESIPLHAAIRRLASDAGVSLEDYRPETERERLQRAAEIEEAALCEWWYRERWKGLRRELAAALEVDFDITDESSWPACVSRLMRWIERERGSQLALELFRAQRCAAVDADFKLSVEVNKRRLAAARSLFELIADACPK